jgi:hypothetical protein
MYATLDLPYADYFLKISLQNPNHVSMEIKLRVSTAVSLRSKRNSCLQTWEENYLLIVF